MAPTNLINLEQCSVSFGIRQVLDNVSLGVNAGDRIGVVGLNGGGKTTLLEILTGVAEPDSGRVSQVSGLRTAVVTQRTELAADTVTLQQLQQARTARRRQLKQQLRDRRSLADALPTDQRHLPAEPAPALDDLADGPERRLATLPPTAAAPAAPAHRLRTYATD